MAKIKKSNRKPKRFYGCNPAPQEPQVYMRDSICPICRCPFLKRDLLDSTIQNDPQAAFLANLVIHYRQDHLRWWKLTEGGKGKEMYRWYKNDNVERRKVNESSKRQIIRQAQQVLCALGITSETFKKLGLSEDKTIELAVTMLDGNIPLITPNQ